MQREKLIQYVEEGLSGYQIAEREGVSNTTIRYWLKKYGLKTRYRFRSGEALIAWNEKNKRAVVRRLQEWDWAAIQACHDEGMGWRELTAKFGVSSHAIQCGKKAGLFKSKTANEVKRIRADTKGGHKHTEETKRKLSLARRAYLAKTGQSGWKTVDKLRSIPCEHLKTLLTEAGFVFVEEYMPLHPDRFFRIDISFPEVKLGIEVNGAQHYVPGTDNLTPYHQERHNLIVGNGWELLEVRYYKPFNVKFVSELIAHIRLVLARGVEPATKG